ncbi:hypothetical protein NEDG_00332 [Nematocida displodere]|uniref:Uncharacterized protein n=1 Tax=Nematocida displodere TaxID=1805483 RepID=A0A177EIV0_9MICR|nr:hypothetical protein NEDG_00332 [Nematocida displodere]
MEREELLRMLRGIPNEETCRYPASQKHLPKRAEPAKAAANPASPNLSTSPTPLLSKEASSEFLVTLNTTTVTASFSSTSGVSDIIAGVISALAHSRCTLTDPYVLSLLDDIFTHALSLNELELFEAGCPAPLPKKSSTRQISRSLELKRAKNEEVSIPKDFKRQYQGSQRVWLGLLTRKTALTIDRYSMELVSPSLFSKERKTRIELSQIVDVTTTRKTASIKYTEKCHKKKAQFQFREKEDALEFLKFCSSLFLSTS